MSSCGRDELVSCTQVFRDGAIESVMLVQSSYADVAWIGGFEDSLVEGHHGQITAALSKLGLDGAAFVMLSFVGIGGQKLESQGNTMAAVTGRLATVPEYYNDLLLPELFVESITSTKPDIYGPLFDLVWNAAGRQSRPPRR